MSLFLFTDESKEDDFQDVLVNTSKIVSVRLTHRHDEYLLLVKDTNDDVTCAKFNTEDSLRAGLAKLLRAMDADVSLAITMKVKKAPSTKSKAYEKLDFLEKLIKDL